MNEETYYSSRAAYEEGYESAKEAWRDEIEKRNEILKRWLEWARAHGHLNHAEGLASDTRETLSQ